MSEATKPAATGKNIRFKQGVNAANIPGCRAVGAINETHLAAASVIKLIEKAKQANPKWFNDHFVEQ